jgi:MoxR-like ATPase
MINVHREIEHLQQLAASLEQQVSQVIVGQQAVVRGVTIALLSGGHVLLEGLPGLGKTMLVRTLARVLQLSSSRIQFTPDLMPADVTGTDMLFDQESGRRISEFQRGPIFANLVLADEINRGSPKTQSALLEAMQERTVTVGLNVHSLPQPFFVLATQNPIELEGTYPLPEAELDRFFFKLNVSFPSRAELHEIVARTTGPEERRPEAIADGNVILNLQQLVREIPVAAEVQDYAIRVVLGTHSDLTEGTDAARKSIRYGASPRAAQAIMLAGRVYAVLAGRLNVSFEDVRRVSPPALRHRIILNYEAEARGETPDSVIAQILDSVPREP